MNTKISGGLAMLKLAVGTAALIVSFLVGALVNPVARMVYAQGTTRTHVEVIHVAQIRSESLREIAPGVRLKDVARTPSGDVGVLEIKSVPSHRHNRTDELIYVISGTAVATFDGKARQLNAGDLVVLPRGTSHRFSSNAGVRILGIAYPKDDATDMEMLTRQ